MKLWKKIVSVGLITAMSVSLIACGNDNQSASGNAGQSNAPVEENKTEEPVKSEETRTIKVGTWFDHYYDSTMADIWANPNVSDEERAQKQFDALKAVEEKYNVKIEFVNLTWAGIQESISTSILAGAPDCDVYECDLAFGVPAALSGYTTDMKTILSEEDDLFNDQMVMQYLDLGNGQVNLLKSTTGEVVVENTYPLGFNKQMLDEAGLEDPRALYERNEWTWDKFREYLIALTKDTDGDGVTDVYGYGASMNELLNGLMMSNGTYIAANETENLTSPEVGEALDFIYNMYNVDKVAYPYYVDDYDTNRYWYKDGKVAFWITAAWIMDQGDDVNSCEFEVCMAPWPIGPSGNKDTNKMKSTGGNYWMIPAGVEDPEFVYKVFYDWNNWYNYDVEYRDSDMTWWEDSVGSEENFEVMQYLGTRTQFDLWNSLGVQYDLVSLLQGAMTPAQFQETYKQPLQDALDTYFK